MKNFKNLISERLKADTAANSVTSEEFIGGVTENFSADVPKVEESENENIVAAIVEKPTADDVPIYTAEQGKIDYWHAFGCSVMLQRFLRRYDLNECTRAYNAFKIGLDAEQHAIIFAIDDENHYFKIQLEENNATPIDETQAEKILNKVNSMRYERLKNAPYWI